MRKRKKNHFQTKPWGYWTKTNMKEKKMDQESGVWHSNLESWWNYQQPDRGWKVSALSSVGSKVAARFSRVERVSEIREKFGCVLPRAVCPIWWPPKREQLKYSHPESINTLKFRGKLGGFFLLGRISFYSAGKAWTHNPSSPFSKCYNCKNAPPCPGHDFEDFVWKRCVRFLNFLCWLHMDVTLA